MKSIKFILLTFLIVATLVPTQIFHYIHVVSDLTEHYQHHQDKEIIDFVSHALTAGNETDSKHPEHHHSPFHQHSIHCTASFVSIIPEIPHFLMNEQLHFFKIEKQKFEVKEPSIFEVTAAIWQPPKIS
jgi:hypothetical protein